MELDGSRVDEVATVPTLTPVRGGRALEAVSVCDLCGSKEHAVELRKAGWTLVRCTNCGLVFTSPRFMERSLGDLDPAEPVKAAPEYLESPLEVPSHDDIWLARNARRALGGERGLNSLDVGCGTGRLVEAFSDEGFVATGIEMSRAAVAVGRAGGRSVGDATIDGIPSGSQHCITAIDVLEQTASPRKFLSECKRVLCRNGLLVMEVPNFGSPAARQLREDWAILHPDTHLFQFGPDTLRRYLSDLGFSHIVTRGRGAREGMQPSRISLGGAESRAPQRMSPAKRLVRYLIGEVLSRGEYIRVSARRRSE